MYVGMCKYLTDLKRKKNQTKINHQKLIVWFKNINFLHTIKSLDGGC